MIAAEILRRFELVPSSASSQDVINLDQDEIDQDAQVEEGKNALDTNSKIGKTKEDLWIGLKLRMTV